ncbi:hypothetical protein LXA43DRAFT_1047315 [Ganoderma leucocontextum]|nr:hypothetical protein LXA43DRAFT_1047315 [Ganoderma leucocontextum]
MFVHDRSCGRYQSSLRSIILKCVVGNSRVRGTSRSCLPVRMLKVPPMKLCVDVACPLKHPPARCRGVVVVHSRSHCSNVIAPSRSADKNKRSTPDAWVLLLRLGKCQRHRSEPGAASRGHFGEYTVSTCPSPMRADSSRWYPPGVVQSSCVSYRETMLSLSPRCADRSVDLRRYIFGINVSRRASVCVKLSTIQGGTSPPANCAICSLHSTPLVFLLDAKAAWERSFTGGHRNMGLPLHQEIKTR